MSALPLLSQAAACLSPSTPAPPAWLQAGWGGQGTATKVAVGAGASKTRCWWPHGGHWDPPPRLLGTLEPPDPQPLSFSLPAPSTALLPDCEPLPSLLHLPGGTREAYISGKP